MVSHATILSGTYPQTDRVNEFGARLARRCRSSLTCSGRVDITRLPSLVPSHSIQETGRLPASIADSLCTTQAFNRRRGTGKNSIGRSAGSASRGSRPAWLARNLSGPFFLWVHMNDPGEASATSYKLSVAAADATVGKLIAVLRTRNLYDDALIVVASDHGESLGGHGEETHGVFLYDETIRVPLLLKFPQNQNSGKRVTARARLVDIAPTILEIAGVPIPSQMQGQSLLRIAKTNADQPVYSASNFPQQAFGWSALESWRAGKYLYIKAPKPELYDLSADPGATRNLAQTSKATLETIAGQLDAFDRRFTDPGNSGPPSLLRVKCKSWRRWDMSDCRNHPFPQARRPRSRSKRWDCDGK